MSFIGILVVTKERALESRGAIKYFIRQALGSIILLMRLILSNRLMPTTVSCVLFRASLILKLGLFPAHV